MEETPHPERVKPRSGPALHLGARRAHPIGRIPPRAAVCHARVAARSASSADAGQSPTRGVDSGTSLGLEGGPLDIAGVTMTANGLDVHAVPEGKGRGIAPIHEVAGSSVAWRHQGTRVTGARCPVIAPNERGGRSPVPPDEGADNIDRLVDDRVATLRTLAAEMPCVIVQRRNVDQGHGPRALPRHPRSRRPRSSRIPSGGRRDSLDGLLALRMGSRGSGLSRLPTPTNPPAAHGPTINVLGGS